MLVLVLLRLLVFVIVLVFVLVFVLALVFLGVGLSMVSAFFVWQGSTSALQEGLAAEA